MFKCLYFDVMEMCADVWRLIYAYLSKKDKANLMRAFPNFKHLYLLAMDLINEYEREPNDYQDWILSCDATLGSSRFSLEKTVECKNCNITVSVFFTHDDSFAYDEDGKLCQYHVCTYCIELDDIWEKCKSCNKKSFADELRNGDCWSCINGVPPLEDELLRQVPRKIIGKRIDRLYNIMRGALDLAVYLHSKYDADVSARLFVQNLRGELS